MPFFPPYLSSSHFRYLSTAFRNADQRTPQTRLFIFQSLAFVLKSVPVVMTRSSSQVMTYSHLFTHLSQFCQIKGPAWRSSEVRSIPSWSSRIRFAICLDVSLSLKSCGVRGAAFRYCSKRPLMKVPKRRGPIFRCANLLSISSSFSRSIRCPTCGP